MKQVQHQLINQWSVLATLTPTEYAAFRDALGSASGFQSPQYRVLEFKLGRKDRTVLARFSHHLEYYRELKHALERPSLYDEFLRYLYRVGHRVPDGARRARLDADATSITPASSKCCRRSISIPTSIGPRTKSRSGSSTSRSTSSRGASIT